MKPKAIRSILALALLIGLVLAVAPVALAASPIYVRPGGDDTLCNGTVDVDYSAGVAPNCAVKTIQKGIDLVDPSGTVYVRAGTYVLTAEVSVNNGITLDGDGTGATIVQVSGTGPRFNMGAGTTLQDFEIVKTDKPGLQNIIRLESGSNVTIKNNTIHGQWVMADTGDVSRAMVVSGGLSGLNIEGNTIYGLRQPAYFSGPTTGTIQNNYVYGTKGWVLEGGNLTFTGNTWGTGANVNVYDIAILGVCPVGPYPDIVAMSNANNGAVIEDQRVSPAVLSVVYVDAGTAYLTDLGGRYHPYSSVAPAITRAVAGGTINVAAGTYVEQVEIAKNLTLKGAGAGTVIQSPATLTKFFSVLGGPNNFPVVYVHDASSVTIQDLVVDGAGLGNANYRFQGIGYHNAGGKVSGVEIKDVRDTPFSGAQHGVALYAYNEDATPRSLEVAGCNIHHFQKNGTALGGAGLTVNVHDTTVTGYGPTTTTAQNGIQVGYSAAGTVGPNNHVSAISYTPSNWVASGILIYDANVNVTGNDVTNAQAGIYLFQGNSNIQDNVVTASQAGVGTTVFSGITVLDPPEALPSPYLEETSAMAASAAASPQGVVAVNVSGNTLTGSCAADSYGLEAYAGYGPDDIAFTATDNTITNWGYGVTVAKCMGSCTASSFASVAVNHNKISNNCQYGMYVGGLTSPVNAEGNWWGAVSGPGPVGIGAGDKVSTNVDFQPWCNEDFSICGYTAATMTPTTGDALFCVGQTTEVTIDIATVANMYGYQFAVTYNKDMASAVGDFVDTFFTGALVPTGWNADCTTTPGTCRFSRTKKAPDVAKTGGGTLVKITFTGVAPGTFPVTIVSDAKLTDIDGELLARTLAPLPLTVCGWTTVSGKVTMQGRSGNNVNLGKVTLTEVGSNFSTYSPAETDFSATDGAFSFTNVPVMPGGTSYTMDAKHGLYLTNSKTVALTSGVALANQNTRLWGGDANNSGKVEIGDLSCIGGSFGATPPGTCTGGSADINADGVVNVQDLAIAGGNFDKESKLPW